MGGMTSLLLLLLAGVTVSTLVDLQKRVVTGKDCAKTEHPYHVVLIPNDGTKNFLCGGSLISNQWILTAKHCWNDGETMTAYLGVHPDKTNTKVKIETKETFKDNGKDDHDIMLLKLPNPADAKFKHIELPDCTKDPRPKDAVVKIAGFGGKAWMIDGTGKLKIESQLQCADMKVVPDLYTSHEHIFFGSGASSTPEAAVRESDSGGGMEYKNKIYGVISSGLWVDGPTAVFMDVCKYMPWIEKIVKPENMVDVTG